MGRARLHSADYPAGGEDGSGLLPDGATFQHVSIGNPQCAIHVVEPPALDALDLPAIGPAIEHHDAFPNRTNVSWWAAIDARTIRARIFERGVGETRSSGTGAIGAAVAHVLGGGDSPVTVRLDGGELEVDVGEDFHVDLTGWAVAVYAAQVSDELLADLGTDG
jgi:diaminopimelate epimerase